MLLQLSAPSDFIRRWICAHDNVIDPLADRLADIVVRKGAILIRCFLDDVRRLAIANMVQAESLAYYYLPLSLVML
jgi:hypothetical protein